MEVCADLLVTGSGTHLDHTFRHQHSHGRAGDGASVARSYKGAVRACTAVVPWHGRELKPDTEARP
jgi:hypothetical protein